MSVLATDNFNRADGGLGSNWSTVTSQNAPLIASSAVQPNGVGVADSVARYNAVSFPDDQYSLIKVVTLNISFAHAVGCIARAASGAQTYYMAFVRGPLGSSAAMDLRKCVAGTITDLATEITLTVATGDILRLEANGTTIRALLNGVQKMSATDSAITSGSAGIYCFSDNDNASDSVLDDWEGGDFSSAIVNPNLLAGSPPPTTFSPNNVSY